jgi:hypothetical protein
VTDATGFISKVRESQITSIKQGMRIEVNPLSAEVSANCIASGQIASLARSKDQIASHPRPLDRDQAARFSKGDVIAASHVDLLELPTFLVLPLTNSVILCIFSRPEDVKAVASEAGVIAETVHAIVDFDENKCREKQTGSGSGCPAEIVYGRGLGRKSTKLKGISWQK